MRIVRDARARKEWMGALVDRNSIGQRVPVARERDVARLNGLRAYVVSALNDQHVCALGW